MTPAGGRFAVGLAIAVARCRDRGYEPTFHHHTATYVEAQWEIERLLELSDVGLCLDTGHLLLGRGEPVSAIRAWADRINQVHLKDARLATLEQIVAEAAPVAGDLAPAGVLPARRRRHPGRRRARSRWPRSATRAGSWSSRTSSRTPATRSAPAAEQRRNREYLRAHGL